MQSLQHKLIIQLADGQFHSGQHLSQSLGVSRTRVHQAVQDLREHGLNVAAVKGRGYCVFDGIDLLQTDAICKAFPQLDVSIFESTNSTNDFCLNAIQNFEKPVLCLAEQQNQGRGRNKKSWQSPFAANIYLSLLQKFDKPLADMAGLTLAIGVCIAELLTQTGTKNVALKWPNDVYVNNAKIAGILTEAVGDALGPCYMVVGIGLNVNMPSTAGEHIDQAWTDCKRSCPISLSRTQWAVHLTQQLLHTLETFEAYGLSAFLPNWQRYDYLQGRTLTVNHAGREITTQAQGITAQGYLRIKDAPFELISGDFAIHPS